MNEITTIIYTDGSCLKNPDGPGGWAFAVVDTTKKRNDGLHDYYCKSGGASVTTNNRMEMTAVIEALKSHINQNDIVGSSSSKLRIFSDSQYVINGITKWMSGWIRNNWRTASGGNVKNHDLWLKINNLLKELGREVEFKWVKGHANNPYNTIVDELARNEALKAQ